MTPKFNSFFYTVDTGFWRDLCQNEGELRSKV